MATLDFLAADELKALATEAQAVDFLYDALKSGLVDPESDAPRLFSPAPGGEFILMPGCGTEYSGVKVITVAPENPRRGKPKIQGVYVLVGSDDLAPRVLMDGPELTLLRTPAVSVLAIRELLRLGPPRPEGPLTVVVYGTGPQALRHLEVLDDVVGPIDAAVIGRRPEAVAHLVEHATAAGLRVRPGSRDDVPSAAVVLTATSSSTPVLDDALIAPDTVVAAMGAHGPDSAELPPALVRRADLVVEGRASAMREAGNLLAARTAAEWADHPIANLADLVTRQFNRRAGVPAVFSGVGMAWEDLVVAAAIYDKYRNSHSRT